MKTCILTISSGEDSQRISASTFPSLQQYAKEIGCDVLSVDFRPDARVKAHFVQVQLRKLSAIYEALENYERVAWVDADVLITPHAPSIFDNVRSDRWGGTDELKIIRENQFTASPDHKQHLIKQHLNTVCWEEGFPRIESPAFYFNCGVQVVSQCHREIYRPPNNPGASTWAEQSLINARLHHQSIATHDLGKQWNMMQWIKDTDYLKARFIHYCGLFDHERLPRILSDLRRIQA